MTKQGIPDPLALDEQRPRGSARWGNTFRHLAACAFAILFLDGTPKIGIPLASCNAAEPNNSPRPAQPEQVELRGKVVCIPELMHELYQTELDAEHEHVYGFRTSDGSIYTLLRTKFSDALFVDARLRAKDLILKGQVYPKSHIFEPTRMWSVRNGTTYDLYYYCSVCNIETVSAGPCACCQGPVELMERPLKGAKKLLEKQP